MSPERGLSRLRAYNVVMGALHAVQGAVMVVLANDSPCR